MKKPWRKWANRRNAVPEEYPFHPSFYVPGFGGRNNRRLARGVWMNWHRGVVACAAVAAGLYWSDDIAKSFLDPDIQYPKQPPYFVTNAAPTPQQITPGEGSPGGGTAPTERALGSLIVANVCHGYVMNDTLADKNIANFIVSPVTGIGAVPQEVQYLPNGVTISNPYQLPEHTTYTASNGTMSDTPPPIDQCPEVTLEVRQFRADNNGGLRTALREPSIGTTPLGEVVPPDQYREDFAHAPVIIGRIN